MDVASSAVGGACLKMARIASAWPASPPRPRGVATFDVLRRHRRATSASSLDVIAARAEYVQDGDVPAFRGGVRRLSSAASRGSFRAKIGASLNERLRRLRAAEFHRAKQRLVQLRRRRLRSRA